MHNHLPILGCSVNGNHIICETTRYEWSWKRVVFSTHFTTRLHRLLTANTRRYEHKTSNLEKYSKELIEAVNLYEVPTRDVPTLKVEAEAFIMSSH